MSLTDRRKEKLERVASLRQPDLTVVIENVHDPHNVSAILRTCDAVGVQEVQLLYTREELPKLGKKSSASAVKWVDRRKFKSVDVCVETLKGEGFAVCATRVGEGARSLYDLDLTRPTAIVVGNEHRGVSDEMVGQADQVFEIPMFGMIQSLNVSVACAVILFEAMRQRAASGGYRAAKLDAGATVALIKRWSKK